MSTSATPAISQVCQKSSRARAAARSRRRALPRPSSSRSRAWKTNASASVNAVLGTPDKQRVVDVVERADLLDVVPHLVDRDVVALVVHAARLDARAQVRHRRRVAAACMRVAGAARRIDDDVRREIFGALGREAEVLEEARDVVLVRLRRRIALARERVELGLGVLGARAKAVVPEIERLERAAEALLDRRRPRAAPSGEVEHLVAASRRRAPRGSRGRRSKRRAISRRRRRREGIGGARGDGSRRGARDSACRARARRRSSFGGGAPASISAAGAASPCW